MTAKDLFCRACGLSFGIVEPCPDHPHNCQECVARMMPSNAGECDRCRQVIQCRERYFVGWLGIERRKLCQRCFARKVERQEQGFGQIVPDSLHERREMRIATLRKES